LTSKSEVLETGLFPGILVFCEVFWVPAFEQSEIFIDLDALTEVIGHLSTLGNLIGSLDAVVVDALNVGAFVGEAGQLLIGLI
jgi:hypothetical protein